MSNQLIFSDGYVNNVKGLEERIKELEHELRRATDLLDEMASSANIHDISQSLWDAEELVGELRSVLGDYDAR